MTLTKGTVLHAAETAGTDTAAQFAVCLDNTGYAVSLEKRKVYQVIPDAEAASFGEVRIIDESGEDYLFPARRFALVNLPQEAGDALRSVSVHE